MLHTPIRAMSLLHPSDGEVAGDALGHDVVLLLIKCGTADLQTAEADRWLQEATGGYKVWELPLPREVLAQ